MGKWGQDMTERVGVYPGTFDPVTSGHMEVIRREDGQSRCASSDVVVVIAFGDRRSSDRA